MCVRFITCVSNLKTQDSTDTDLSIPFEKSMTYESYSNYIQ